MARIMSILIVISMSDVFFSMPEAKAQDTEEQFHDLFITAGYSTAFGAALGAAFLGLTDDPSSKLSFVYIGASLGFIGGSLMGTYVIFSPMIVDENAPIKSSEILASLPRSTSNAVALRPTIDIKKGSITGLEAGFTLLNF